jgi:hypothetical protein
MKATLSILICFSLINICKAQYKHDYVWMAGDPPLVPNSINGVIKFDFNGDSLSITEQDEGLGSYLTNASICDHDGNLLFYSNGCSINNSQHELMQNGAGLNPGVAYVGGNCPDYGNYLPQGIIILPLPNNNNRYYVIHQAETSGLPGDFDYFNGKLYYSLVDMTLDGGNGKVVEKNKPILSDTMFANISAVKHDNGIDWWVLVSKAHTNRYFKILLTSNGIDSIYTQDIGINMDQWWSGGGQSFFSPDGTRFARYYKGDQLLLYDFDRQTGFLSNFRQLYADTTEGFWGGLSFSSSSRFLYVNTQGSLWQFDLLAPDIQASKILVGKWDGFYDENNLQVTFYLMQLGPDCKIYIVAPNGTRHMHVINNPNEPGLACDFRQRGVTLPAINGTSIPNFPNYRLGTGYPVCDSNIVYVSSGFVLPPPKQEMMVYPNPASVQVTLALPTPLHREVVWSLHDQLGREVARALLPVGQQGAQLGVEGLAVGLYFWQVENEGRQVASGKLVIAK